MLRKQVLLGHCHMYILIVLYLLFLLYWLAFEFLEFSAHSTYSGNRFLHCQMQCCKYVLPVCGLIFSFEEQKLFLLKSIYEIYLTLPVVSYLFHLFCSLFSSFLKYFLFQLPDGFYNYLVLLF
jgi:hypothetical protein